MKQETLADLGHGAITLSVGTGVSNQLGWFNFINANAAGLGFIATVFFGLVGLVFYYLTLKKSKLADQNKINFDNYKKESDGNFKNLDGKIQIIEEHVSKINNGIDTLIKNNKKE